MVEQAVTDDAIKGLYREQMRLSKQSEEFHARQIVVATAQDAASIRRQLAAGAAFDVLASERSIDSATRFNGGDLGYFTADVMPQTYAVALKDARPGALIGPFKSDAGWVLLKVEDRRMEPPVSLEQARPQIVRFLTYDEVRDVLEKLRGRSKVKILIAPAQTGPGAPREPASATPPAQSGNTVGSSPAKPPQRTSP
jgi:peptidyl-prolyl cis-trans isomerase C